MRLHLLSTRAAAPAGLIDQLPEGWNVQSVDAVERTLEAAAGQAFDAIVCSVHVPGATAESVLARVRDAHPAALRILSLPPGTRPGAESGGEADLVQQCIGEPLLAQDLRAALRRVMTTRALLGDPALRELLGRVDRLRSPPRTYLALQRAARDPDVHMGQISDLIAGDPALASRVLRMANSAFHSRGQAVTRLDSAVARLGLETIRRLVLASEAFAGHPDGDAGADRALLASTLAAALSGRGQAETTSTAALLAGVGELLPEDVVSQLDQGRPDWRGLPRRDLFGACLLALWGLPMGLVEAVAYRARPSRLERGFMGPVGCVHVACSLAAGLDPDAGELEAMGVSGRLPDWLALRDRLSGSRRAPAA